MTQMGTTALVTGATGFLGGYLVDELQTHSYEVIANGRRVEAMPPGAEPLVGDLDALRTVRREVDVVIHCAALSTPWGRWADFRHANVDGTAAVLDFARANGVRRLVHVSSPSIYAAPRDQLAIREDQALPPRALNGYIRSKREAEALLRAVSAAPGSPEIVVVRPRGLIGRGDPVLVPHLLARADRGGIPMFRGGAQLIDLSSVENVARALRLAAEVPDAAGQTFNITNGDPRPFRDLVAQLAATLGRALPTRALPLPPIYAVAGLLEAVCSVLPGHPEPPVTRYTLSTVAYSQTLDIDRARAVLGYEPHVTIDHSLASYGHG